MSEWRWDAILGAGFLVGWAFLWLWIWWKLTDKGTNFTLIDWVEIDEEAE